MSESLFHLQFFKDSTNNYIRLTLSTLLVSFYTTIMIICILTFPKHTVKIRDSQNKRVSNVPATETAHQLKLKKKNRLKTAERRSLAALCSLILPLRRLLAALLLLLLEPYTTYLYT